LSASAGRRGRVAWIAGTWGTHRGAPHPPPAAGPFLFFEALALDRQAVQPRGPTTAGTGTRRLPADRVMPRRFHHTLGPGRRQRHCHFPDGPSNCCTYARPCTRRRCRPFMRRRGPRTVGWLAAPCRRGYWLGRWPPTARQEISPLASSEYSVDYITEA
jgi:hypothetical protein